MHLEQAVQDWCRKVHPAGARHEERIAELVDHLHCEIETLLASGRTEREAFALATERLGAPAELAEEHRKNGPLPRRLCQAVRRADSALMGPVRRHFSPRAASSALLAVSLLAAGLMLLSGLLIDDSGWSASAVNLIIAAWWVPFSLLSTRAGEELPPEGSAGA